jgi:Domain of unknown function DUF11/Dolichyl-phosphate-mannose-protein mannosyltransferase
VVPARWTPLRAGLLIALGVFLLLGWQGVTTVGRNGADDAGAHAAYAQYLDEHGRLPPRDVNYEFSSPPLFAAVAVAAERVVRNAPSVAAEVPWNPVTRALWLLLVAGGAVALTARSGGVRVGGVVALVLGGLWGLDEALSLGRSVPWSVGQLIALVCGAGLIAVSGLIAREVWPDHLRRALATAAMVAAYPVVYRMSVLFHPEMPFALLCALALLVSLRAARRGWPARQGWWLGAALGGAALTRQPAIVLIGVLGIAPLVLGGRRAGGFLARAAIIVVLLAGPWWGYAAHRFGNPLQSNLEPRQSLMLSRQPASFYLSFPVRSLVVHPFRPDFSDQLLPKVHAELWSDWFGVIHGDRPSWNLERVTSSTQSVLGFVADLLALGGLFALALPGAVRVLRRRSRAPADVGLGLLGTLAIVSFAAFVIELIRFPQQYGDPIKSSYLLFTAPCWAVLTVAAWSALLRRRRLAVVLAAVAGLYVVSYGADLAGALTRHIRPGNLGGPAGYVDLVAGIQKNSPNPGVGGPIDFLAGVQNVGSQTADHVILTVYLPPAMHLLGPPFYERGSGCTGTSTIVCDLDFLAAQSSTLIRFSVQVTQGGPQTMTATASSDEFDAHPGDNTTSYTVTLGPP